MSQTFGQIEQEKALDHIIEIAAKDDKTEDGHRTIAAVKALFLDGEYSEINDFAEGIMAENVLWAYAGDGDDDPIVPATSCHDCDALGCGRRGTLYDPAHDMPCSDPERFTHHPDDVAAGNLPTDTERAQGGDDDPATIRAMRHACYPFDPDPTADPIAPATITVREYLEGEEERPVFLHTHCGTFQVTGVHFFSDGPWLVTGRGLTQSSWCVAYSDRLYFDKDEAERSAS